MLSVEKIKYSNTNRINFNGHNLSENENGEKIYKFYLPKISFDNAQVVLRKFRLDNNGNIILKNPSSEYSVNIEKGETSVQINPKEYHLKDNEALAYKFIIDGKEYTDKHKGVLYDDKYYNLADTLTSDILETPRSIYHLVPNSFNPILKRGQFKTASGDIVTNDDAQTRTNHFMQYDSNFQTIIDKIPYIKSLGFRSILSAPVFGQDNLSNASYWTNNPYQLTERFGTMEDYKKLQIELFKNSMSFIADGAFSSEGLQGIHYRDILRNGEQSPFINWFDISGFQKLGVLPDTKTAYKNFDIRVVNSPILWHTDENGLPLSDFGSPNPHYNKEQETFIQIYDRRLTSEEQLKKDEIFTSYDIKNPENKDDISDWSDSIFPYAFPVKIKHLLKKAKEAKSNPQTASKEFLKDWDNFSLTRAKESSGAALWDGNKDLVKLQYILPAYRKQINTEDAVNYATAKNSLTDISDATQDVQDYIIGIGQYWTNKTAKILREYIANQLGNATTAEDFKNIINSKAGNSLPASIKYITQQQVASALDNNYEATYNLHTPLTIQDAIEEYPLEALEVSDDITGIFSYPSFKEKAHNSVYKKQIPDMVKRILAKLDNENLSCGKFLSNGDINEGSEKALQLISDDIVRFILIKALAPDFEVEDIINNNLSKLKNITAKKICKNTNTPTGKADMILDTLENNIPAIADDDIDEMVNYLKTRLTNITPENLRIADLIIDKTEAGLNWRIDAAKDIADKDNHKEGRATTAETWKFGKEFWKKFNDGVRLYNSHSYRIGEYTDTALPDDTKTTGFATSGILEDKLIEQGGFTTQSNYNYMFSLFLRFLTGIPERYGYANQNALDLIFNKLDRGWNDMAGYLFSGSKNNIVYSHSAVGNHDKQRIANAFSMNVLLAYLNEEEFIAKVNNDEYWANIGNEINKDLMQSSLEDSKFYGKVKAGAYKSLFEQISPRNLAKLASYTNAFATVTKENPKQQEIMKAVSKSLDMLAEKNNKTQNTFFYKNFEDTFNDILNNIQDTAIADTIKTLKEKLHSALTNPARIRELELARLMVAMPCNPTIYAGDELLETGGEEKAKNVSLQNRGRLHWEYLTNEKYSHINNFKDKLAEIYNLRNDENLTSLTTGDTILLKQQGGDKIRGVVGMYRYNDKDDAIILIHNAGFNSSRNFDENITMQIRKIDLSAGNAEYIAEQTFDNGNCQVGLPDGKKLPENTIYVDALDETKEYIVNADGNIYAKDDSAINLEHTVTILKRKN